MDLVLIGLRGSGKSTLGEKLAAKYKLRFIDLDRRTPGAFGLRSVADAWAKYGEEAFRKAELAALEQAIAEDPEILALGGGTPMIPEAQQLLEDFKQTYAGFPHDKIVYLRAPAEVLAQRLRESGTSDRPSLTGNDPIDEIPTVLAQRDPIYLKLADNVIETADLDTREVLKLLDIVLGWG
jgi:shikimate kinase